MKEKIEVLSPVGDKDGFFASIRSGCDAVYMGLPKYNARMKAENIDLDNLSDLIRYAHLKGVKVYITMNTLLSNSELGDAVALVGKCYRLGVDAFIMQDLGLISECKKAYPDIVLHGSTQLGVHNVMGAKVAKRMGLERVVLSRECTLADIREIAESVDIELEVFVQGANCICFSGNCYLSSIKCGASGNRGECKQLCRLPYVLHCGKRSLEGFTLSPRDNCLLEDLADLASVGVCSIKIEGRLRHTGYVSVATSVYREAVDDIYSGNVPNYNQLKSDLRRVFSRGEYVRGYNDSNDIIDHTNNNHLGLKIGKVVSLAKFKDLYKISMKLSRPISSGDGLKFKYNNNIVSIGVGNVEFVDNKTIVYSKYRPPVDSEVYLSLDRQFEESMCDKSRYLHLEISAQIVAGKPIFVKFASGDISREYVGDVVDRANTRAITVDNISQQLGKVDREVFDVPHFEIETCDAFLPLAKLNEIRRLLISQLEEEILRNLSAYEMSKNSGKINEAKRLDGINNCEWETDVLDKTFSVVDENCDIIKLAQSTDNIILSPTVYSVDVISKFKSKYEKVYSSPLLIDLPIIVRSGDLGIISDIVETFGSDCIFVANNIYGLYFCDKANVWAGSGLNIVNFSALSAVKALGACNYFASIEKWASRLPRSNKVDTFPLMTITSCPIKHISGCDCVHCGYVDGVSFVGQTFALNCKRVKIRNCYFQLFDSKS